MKTTLLITGSAVAAVALGAYIKRAVVPVTAAFRLGRSLGIAEGTQERRAARQP